MSIDFIRPYQKISLFESLFDELKFRIHPDLDWEVTDNIEQDSSKFNGFPSPQIEWVLSEDKRLELNKALQENRLLASDLDLVAIVRNRQAKRMAVPIKVNLAELVNSDNYHSWPLSLKVQDEFLFNTSQAIEFAVSLVLNQEKSLTPGFPSQKATWLCTRVFKLSPPNSNPFQFEYQVLTDEIRQANQLPKNSLLHIECVVPLHEVESFSEAVITYIDSEYQANIKSLNQAQSDILQTNLVINVMLKVVTQTIKELQSEGIKDLSQLPDSVFKTLVQSFSKQCKFLGTSKLSDDEIFERLLEDPSFTTSLLEDIFNVKKMTEKLDSGENQ